MKGYNFLFKTSIWEADMEDFKMPYSIYGNFDKEVMINRYKKMANKIHTHGIYVRINNNGKT